MQTWEYMFIRTADGRGSLSYGWPIPKPFLVNGVELKDWKKGPALYEYVDALGSQRWEMVSADGVGAEMLVVMKRTKG